MSDPARAGSLFTLQITRELLCVMVFDDRAASVRVKALLLPCPFLLFEAPKVGRQEGPTDQCTHRAICPDYLSAQALQHFAVPSRIDHLQIVPAS